MPSADLDRLLVVLTLEIAVIIAASRLLGLLFRRVGQPQVIGEVVAGILLGPSLLGWLAPGVSAALFPPQALPFLKVLSELGIVFFMFLIGLELDPALLRDRGRAALVISGTSIVVPFALGAAVALALHAAYAGPQVSRVGFAVFLGAAMAITAFPVLARILIERDLLRTRLGALTLTCAAVDDIAGWCLLSLIAAFGHAGNGLAGVGTLVAVGVFVAVMVWLVRPLLVRLAALHESRGGLTQNLLASVFVLLLLSALATQVIGIHAIFGGFIFGAVMPKGGPFARALADKLEDFATVFLLPLYFAYTGLRMQVGLLAGPADWATAALLIGVAVAGKFGGSLIASRLVGLGWREASALGVLVNTRGLMELIILNIGLDLGLITPTVFAMMVLMAIATTMMTAPMLGLLYSPERLRAERIAREAAADGGRPVLVSVALSVSGPRLFDLAAMLSRNDAPRVYALHVAPPVERGALGADLPRSADDGEQALEPLLAHARGRGLDVRPVLVTSRQPAEEICEVARLKGVELVLLGWHKPVFAQSVLGGTLDRVLRRAAADVAVLIDKGLPERIGSILVPYAGTPHDRLALQLAARLSRRAGVPLTVLHVVPPGSAGAHREREAEASLRAAADPTTAPQARVIVVEASEPADSVIVEAARHDLTVLGVGEEWQLARGQFGLRAERVVAEIPTSLLIVRAAEQGTRAA